ncbi:hypothetical protein [Algicola sagamiensis]|uniref:hypothetical protein n=1 Tax=Algicola sagamiensis TaxID=163869 RepID=UPI00035FE0D4|nr:hypothetical protein [Algicola sagamiensis]
MATAELLIERRLSPLPCSTPEEISVFRKDNPHITGDMIMPGTAYICRPEYNSALGALSKEQTWVMRSLQSLSPESRRGMLQLIDYCGGTENALGLADFLEDKVWPYIESNWQGDSVGIFGAGVGGFDARTAGFLKEAGLYEKALIEYRKAVKSNAPKHTQTQLWNKAKRIYHTMNTKFQVELQRHMDIRRASKKRGTIWSSADRGKNLARSSKTATKIELSKTDELQKLAKLGKAAEVLGKGALVLDAGLRVNNVLKDKEAGKDWQKTAVKETVGFAAGAGLGILAGTAVVAAGAFLAVTPVGWFVVIAGSLAVGFAASKIGDAGGKWAAEKAYEKSSSFSWWD